MKLVAKCILFGVVMFAMHLLSWVEYEWDDIGRPGPMWLHQVVAGLNYILKPIESLATHFLEIVHITSDGMMERQIPYALDLLAGALFIVIFWAGTSFAIVIFVRRLVSSLEGRRFV